MHCVIGSGPAGVACAKALLARGVEVLMLDVGLELEPERAQFVHHLAGVKPSDWTEADRARLRGQMTADSEGIMEKLSFGSDFPHREVSKKKRWQGRGVSVRPSFALGGLSNIWGAAMLPFRDGEISDWPVKNSELAPHHRAVLAFTGLAAQRDDLEELFPLHCENLGVLLSSRQADLFLGNLNRHRESLRGRGWRYGRARLAVRAADSPNGVGCVLCGACMSSCPYGCIYNSADTVRELQADKNFHYQRDVVVTSLREDKEKVFITGIHRETSVPLAFEARRAYLGAGAISTTQIVLRSQADYDQPLTMRDCQIFFIPMLLRRRTRGVQDETLYTLSQLFIELNRPGISRHSVHLQLYTYSDIIGQAVRKTLGPLKMFSPQLEERIVVLQGFLHSDDSGMINATLKRREGGDFLQLDAQPNPQTRRIVKKVIRELLVQSRRLGGMVVPPMLQVADIGRSSHYGGSWPMREKPGHFESDRLGRPHGWSRIHAVDASVLPSIPATTITFPVMANAHRIGWETATL